MSRKGNRLRTPCCFGFALHLCLRAMTLQAAGLPAPIRQAQAAGLNWRRDDGSIALMRSGVTVWQFNYSPSLSKPYFHPVALPGGADLTWLSPPDHHWHLALFFSWKYLNQVNYWEETDGVTVHSRHSTQTVAALSRLHSSAAMGLAKVRGGTLSIRP